MEMGQAAKIDLQDKIKEWQALYKMFGLEKDFSDLLIPEKPAGLDRLLIVAQGLTPNQEFNKLKELMPVYKFEDDLDIFIPVRKTNRDYAIWTRDQREADDFQKEEINSITLEERFLFELKYFLETGQHLDVQNITRCAGSRDAAGRVPRVCWSGFYSMLYISCYGPGGMFGRLYSREVVS